LGDCILHKVRPALNGLAQKKSRATHDVNTANPFNCSKIIANAQNLEQIGNLLINALCGPEIGRVMDNIAHIHVNAVHKLDKVRRRVRLVD